MKRQLTVSESVLVVVVTLSLLAAPAFPAILYVKPTGNDGSNGSSWALAKRTVQAGVNAAADNDEVWVAKGTYAELVTFKSGVALYGGFVGTETSRSQRDWRANLTILDARANGVVVTFPSGMSQTTRIDGFTIRNGYNNSYGGGIFCDQTAAPVIANNTITGNSAAGDGGGIYCYACSPTIANNTIVGNTAPDGGGIACAEASPTIANNAVVANSASYAGGAIYWRDASASMTNNTIVGNTAPDGGGIYSYGYNTSATILNNIIAFGSSGIYNVYSEGLPVEGYNCVYQNADYNYSGLSAGTGDFSADPKLASVAYGNIHIQPDSPCRNAGNDDDVLPGWPDMDGQPRIQGVRVDMGADESDGTTWVVSPRVVRVSPSGYDANDGTSWALAKRTVQAAIDALSPQGGEVWVGTGQYYEAVTLRPYAYVYGGFSGSETSRSQRNWLANPAVLDGTESTGSVVTARAGYTWAALDGFTIQNGTAENGGGVFCTDFASPIVANNRIVGNSASNTGGGVCCYNRAAPTIASNIITGNSAPNGGGFYCYDASPLLASNVIATNTTSGAGGGVHCSDCSATVVNNTIVENTATTGGGIYCWDSSATIANNIIAFGSSGVYAEFIALPTLRNNCLYSNSGSDYSGIPPENISGDISADPLFVDKAAGDYHLAAGSPCIDAGSDADVQPGWKDIDAQPRILGAHVDIGADEVTVQPLGQLKGQVTDGEKLTDKDDNSAHPHSELPGADIKAYLNGNLMGEAVAQALWAVYEIDNLPDGTYTVVASYQDYPQQARMAVVSSGNTTYVNFPLGMLLGQVAGQVGAVPYTGATVSAYSTAGLVHSTTMATTPPGLNPWAIYSFSPLWLPVGTYVVVASYNNLCQIKLVDVPGDWTKCLNFYALTPAATLSGQVVDAITGDELVGATVKAYMSEYLLAQANPVGGPWAVYQFGGLPAGAYVVTASCPGYRDQSRKKSLSSGEVGYLNFFLQPQ